MTYVYQELTSLQMEEKAHHYHGRNPLNNPIKHGTPWQTSWHMCLVLAFLPSVKMLILGKRMPWRAMFYRII